MAYASSLFSPLMNTLCIVVSACLLMSNSLRLRKKQPSQALLGLADCTTLAILMEGRNDFPKGTSNKLGLWAKLLTEDFAWKPECILYYYDPTVRDTKPPKVYLRQNLPGSINFLAVDRNVLPKTAKSLSDICKKREGRCPERVLFAYSGHGGNGVLQLPQYEQLQSTPFLNAIDHLHSLTPETKVFVFMQACMSGGFFGKHQLTDAALFNHYAPLLAERPRLVVPILGGMSNMGSAAVLGSIGALMDAQAMCDAHFCRTEAADCKPAEVTQLIKDIDESIHNVVKTSGDEGARAWIAWRDLQQMVSKWKDAEDGKLLLRRLEKERLVGPVWGNECGTQEWDISWKERHNMTSGPHLADCKMDPKRSSAFLSLSPEHFGCHKTGEAEMRMEDAPGVMIAMLTNLVHNVATAEDLEGFAITDAIGNHRGEEVHDDDLLAKTYAEQPESILALTSAMPSLICNTAMQLPKKTISAIRDLRTGGTMKDLVMSVLGIEGLSTKGLALPVGNLLANHLKEPIEENAHFRYQVPLAQADVYRITHDGKQNTTGRLIKSGTPMAFGNMIETKLMDFFAAHAHANYSGEATG